MGLYKLPGSLSQCLTALKVRSFFFFYPVKINLFQLPAGAGVHSLSENSLRKQGSTQIIGRDWATDWHIKGYSHDFTQLTELLQSSSAHHLPFFTVCNNFGHKSPARPIVHWSLSSKCAILTHLANTFSEHSFFSSSILPFVCLRKHFWQTLLDYKKINQNTKKKGNGLISMGSLFS